MSEATVSEVTPISLARDAIARLLDALGITSVICVDDVYARNVTIDDLLRVQKVLSEAELREIFGRPEDVFPNDREVRRQSFREAWEAQDSESQNKIATSILRLVSTRVQEEPDDFAASSALAEVIGETRLQKVRPTEWPAMKDKIKSADTAGKMLILFDQDLSSDGGAVTGGMVLIQDVLTDSVIGSRVMCGLLTHTVTIENQHDKWVELSKPPLDQDRFVVVAKGWLSIDPMGFARMLKQVALTPDCREMKKRVKELLDLSTADAQSQVDSIHIDDFESMVFRASKQEGLWEPDMLFRLFGIFQRIAVRHRAYSDNDLKTRSARLRVVSDIPTHSSTVLPPGTWKIQRQEMYEPGDYINKLHLPIEIGDIFKKTDGQAEKYYLLLGQPCDLMVRSDGKRSPESTDITLAEIFTSKDEKRYTVLLPHFSEDPTQKFFVRLRPTHSVNPCVLDLCVYDENGESRIDVDAACTENVLPAWKLKYEHLKKYANSILQRYESFGQAQAKDQNAKAFLKSESAKQFPLYTSNSGLFKGSMSFDSGHRRLNFNCKRVMRLHRPRAIAIAQEYVHHLIRPAFDRDLGEI